MITSDPIPSGAAIAASPEQIAALQRDLDCLLIALAAVKWPSIPPGRCHLARIGENVTDQATQAWLAANLLIRTVFETLYHEAQDTIAVIRLMLPIPPP
jgi:hypothetical protein